MDIAAYTLRRIALIAPLLLGITLLCFTIMKALPGDPVQGMVGERASEQTIERIRKQIGEDRSFAGQYFGYVSLLARGEFGESLYSGRDVLSDIKAKFPNTLALALASMLLAVPLGLALGFTAAYRRGTRTDRLITTISVLGISMPVFWIGLLLMLVASFWLRLLPPSGTGDIRFIVLPAITLSLPAIATITRVTRTSVIDVMGMPYVNTARSKGLSPARVTLVHILKNAMIPIVTVIGLDFGSYLNGAVLTETIFGWDGIGRFAMDGIIKRDYPVVIGAIIAGTVAFVLVNLIVDLTYQFLDPRVRLGRSNEQ